MILRLLIFLIAFSASAADASGPPFTVSGMSLPASLASPVCDQGAACGTSNGALTRSVMVLSLVISNTDSSSHTVTVEDCQSTPFQFLPAVTVAANSTLPYSGQFRFAGCLQWSASSTKVQGSITFQ